MTKQELMTLCAENEIATEGYDYVLEEVLIASDHLTLEECVDRFILLKERYIIKTISPMLGDISNLSHSEQLALCIDYMQKNP